MKRPISDLQLPGIVVYRTRTDYRNATGREAPPYNYQRPLKNWIDPAAASGPGRNAQYWALATNPQTGGVLLDGKGLPYMEMFTVDRRVAATEVNLIPEGGISSMPGEPLREELPIPLRPLGPGESFLADFGGAKWDDGVPNDPKLTQGPDATIDLSNRQLIEAIYYKVVLGR